MDVRLLGPLDVYVDGREVPLGGRRAKVILAVLAMDANRALPVERLVDAVWEEDPPETARSQVQICVSGLRRAFAAAGAPDVIQTRPPGYLLQLEPGQLDADVFDTLVAQARALAEQGLTAPAAQELRRAAQLWRGPALAGLPGRVVRAGARLLDERRLAATEERIRLDLALGRHEEVTGELLGLIADNPMRERLHAYLMLALYRGGRQAEALQAYRRARTMLVDELGIEPSAELRALEHAILLGSDELLPGQPAPQAVTAGPPARAPLPQQLPSDIADFTGRVSSVDQVCQALAGDPAAGTRAVTVVAVSGPGGIGKTALAVHAAHRMVDQFPDGQLYAAMNGSGPHPAGAAEVLVRFLRALGMAESSLPDGLDARAELYRSCLADRRMLVLLDDVADEAQVRPLLPGSVSCRVLLTSRSRLPGLAGVRRIDLDTLGQASSVGLLSRIAGAQRVAAEPQAAQEIVGLCGGLPLALRIAGARLAARPHWRLAQLSARLGDQKRRLDELQHGELGVRPTLLMTYAGLGVDERRLLRRLSLVDMPEPAGWVGAALLDMDPFDAEELLERLVEAQVLQVRAAAAYGACFRLPELVRVFARERAEQEESAAEAEAARRRVFGTVLGLAEAAHRAEYGGDFTILHGPAPRPDLPQDVLAAVVAEPLAWLESQRSTLIAAVRQSAGLGWSDLCWDLALTAVTLFEARGHFDDWRQCATWALECATQAGDGRGQAAMLHALGALEVFQRRADDASATLAQALDAFEACGDGHGRALVLRNLAHLDRLGGRSQVAQQRYEQALAGLDAAGDLVGLAHVRSNMAALRIDAGDLDEARDLLDEALAACRDVGSRRAEAQVLYRLGELGVERGELGQAAESFGWVLRLTRHLGDPIGQMYALLGLGGVRHREGLHDQASSCLAEALQLARTLGERLVEGRALHALGELDAARGRADLAAGRLAGAAEIFGEVGAVAWQQRAQQALAGLGTGRAVTAVRSTGPVAGGRTADGWAGSRSGARRPGLG